MGRNQVDGDMVFADVDFGVGGGYENGVSFQQHQIHRKHRRKKGDISDAGATVLVTNGDADIVTPYQNGHYSNGYQNNHHHHRSRLPHRHSSVSGADGEAGEEDQLAQQLKAGYGDYLSPSPHLPLQHLLLDDQRGVGGGQSSINNAITAITVAPSRTNLNDSNVFAGGRPTNLTKRPNHHRNNNRHHKHKGRSRTPDFTTSSNHKLRLPGDDQPHDSQSILNRIDLSIKQKFGGWDSDEGGEATKKQVLNGATTNGFANGKAQRVPYFIPKSVGSDTDVVGLMGNGDDLNLPRLFKPYESEVAASRKVLNDKSFKVCLSRDNDDPNSILSQAKKTLSYVSGQS